MNEQEARFLLRAYRPDGRDATDPRFAEALAMAQRDPQLRAWFDHERTLDRAVASKLGSIPPPTGLREAILAGARASRPRRVWWTNPVWLAAAAAVALLLAVGVRNGFAGAPAPTAQLFATMAMDDLAYNQNDHIGHPGGLNDLVASLSHSTGALPGHFGLSLAELKQKGCRTITFAGRPVFELCFERDGRWYHLYAARIEDFGGTSADSATLLMTKGSFAATAWKDSQHIYALVSGTGAEALKRLL